MNSNKQAFTLIELLVVVLIIGILAAVALPQYQKAVDKSRYSTMLPYVKALANAQKVYYLANGEYPTDWKNLDVGFPTDISLRDDINPIIGFTEFEITSNYAAGFLRDSNQNRIASYVIYSPITTIVLNGTAVKDRTLCLSYGKETLDRGDQICKSLNGQLIAKKINCGTNTCSAYLL